MIFRTALIACAAPMLAVAACSGTEKASLNDAATAEIEVHEPKSNLDAEDIELPPMVARSPSYRCDDSKALYVDVLSDNSAVLVRDSRAEVPRRLERDGDSGPFTGEERMLNGTGAQVTYSGPERAKQSCRQAAI